MKKIISTFITVLVMTLFLSASVVAATSAPILSKSKISLKVSKTTTLKVYNTTAKPTWSSNKKKIVTVSRNGKVTAKQAGTAVLSAKINGKKLKCKITVINDFSGGNGTKSNPFQVQTFEQLKKIKNYRGKHFIQTADIDCGGKKLKTMFSAKKPFTGTYNGQGYTIRNFVLTSANSRLGIFGETGKKSILKNICLENVSAKVKTSGTLHAGALVGESQGTVVGCKVNNINISVTDTSGNLNACGGMAGRIVGSLRQSEAYNVTISQTRDVGGLAGAVTEHGAIEDCYVENITASATGGAGATVGSLRYASASNCTVRGTLKLDGYYRYDNNFGFVEGVTWY